MELTYEFLYSLKSCKEYQKYMLFDKNGNTYLNVAEYEKKGGYVPIDENYVEGWKLAIYINENRGKIKDGILLLEVK